MKLLDYLVFGIDDFVLLLPLKCIGRLVIQS